MAGSESILKRGRIVDCGDQSWTIERIVRGRIGLRHVGDTFSMIVPTDAIVPNGKGLRLKSYEEYFGPDPVEKNRRRQGLVD